MRDIIHREPPILHFMMRENRANMSNRDTSMMVKAKATMEPFEGTFRLVEKVETRIRPATRRVHLHQLIVVAIHAQLSENDEDDRTFFAGALACDTISLCQRCWGLGKSVQMENRTVPTAT